MYIFMHICNNNKEEEAMNLRGKWGAWKELEGVKGMGEIV